MLLAFHSGQAPRLFLRELALGQLFLPLPDALLLLGLLLRLVLDEARVPRLKFLDQLPNHGDEVLPFLLSFTIVLYFD